MFIFVIYWHLHYVPKPETVLWQCWGFCRTRNIEAQTKLNGSLRWVGGIGLAKCMATDKTGIWHTIWLQGLLPAPLLFKQQSEFLISRLHIIANYNFLDFWLLLVIFMQGKINFRSCCCLKYKPKVNESKIILISISIIFATCWLTGTVWNQLGY